MSALRALALVVLLQAIAAVPHDGFEVLEIVPVVSVSDVQCTDLCPVADISPTWQQQLASRRSAITSLEQIPRQLLARIPPQILAECQDGMSPACQAIFNKISSEQPIFEISCTWTCGRH